jgi:hypothetical protein
MLSSEPCHHHQTRFEEEKKGHTRRVPRHDGDGGWTLRRDVVLGGSSLRSLPRADPWHRLPERGSPGQCGCHRLCQLLQVQFLFSPMWPCIAS